MITLGYNGDSRELLRRFRSFLLLIAVYISVAVTGLAQYHFDSWTTDNGLPYNRIFSILQTRDGYLWMATADGLVRYDGVRFTVFNAGNSPGIRSNRCTSVYEDKQGTLWIGTEDTGLIRYSNGVFTTFGPEQGVPYNVVRRIWTDDQGNLIVFIGDNLYKWENNKAIPYPLPAEAPPIHMVSAQQDRRIWYRDQKALYIIAAGHTMSVTKAEGLTSLDINTVFEDHDGNFWIGTNNAGLDLLKKDGTITVYTVKDGLPENTVQAIDEDQLGNLWFGAGRSGVVLFRNGRFTTFTTAQGLSNNEAVKLYVDRENTLWIGTNGYGLNKSSRDVIGMLNEKSGMPGANVYPIMQDHTGDIWLGIWPKGVTRYSNGRFELISSKDQRLGANVTALFEDRDGAIWSGFYNGLARLKAGQVTQYTDFLGHDIHFVSAVIQDRDGAMWAGTNKGAFRFKDGDLTLFEDKDGLAGDDVRAILEDRNGAIWAGSYGGLAKYENGKWQTFKKKDGLSGEKVRTIYEDADGVLWVGTYDGGITRIKNGKIVGITQKDGLYSNGAFQILEDDRGFFWMTCNTGIYRISKQELNDFADGKIKSVFSSAYGKSDGMTDAESNGGTQPAGIKTRDGQLWFPTQAGVAVIDPKEIPFNPLPPPVVIEDCLLDRAATDCRQGLKIEPGQQNLEIHYTGLSFIKPQQVRFKYRLIGLDDDWVDAGTRRTAYYSHIPPGDYTFSVMAANSDGVWSKEVQSIRVTVIPPFWRTWWFYVLVVLVIGGIGFLIYRQRVLQLEKRSAMQTAFSRQLIESQENERMRIASELHDGLGQNLLVIKNRALFGLAEPADAALAQKQLGEISSMASQAISEVRTIARNLRPYQLDRLGLTMAIESIASGVSTSSNIAFTSDIDSIDNLLSSEGEINLYRIVQEAVNNIVKHSEATRARITVKRTGDMIEVYIHDNGKGFNIQEELSAGLGLAGLSERARILGGRILIESASGKGTTVTLRFNVAEGQNNGENGRN